MIVIIVGIEIHHF